MSLTDFLFPKGVPKISLMVKRMLDNMPSIYFRFCWILLCPLLLLVRFRVSNYSSALAFQLCINLSKMAGIFLCSLYSYPALSTTLLLTTEVTPTQCGLIVLAGLSHWPPLCGSHLVPFMRCTKTRVPFFKWVTCSLFWAENNSWELTRINDVKIVSIWEDSMSKVTNLR